MVQHHQGPMSRTGGTLEQERAGKSPKGSQSSWNGGLCSCEPPCSPSLYPLVFRSVFPGNREVPQLTDDAQDKEGLYKLWRQLLPPALPTSSLKATRSTGTHRCFSPSPKKTGCPSGELESRKCELTVGSD